MKKPTNEDFLQKPLIISNNDTSHYKIPIDA